MRIRFIDTLVLEWLDNHRDYAIVLVPLLAFAEACIGIGLFVSGAVLLLVSAALYSNGIASLELILPLAFLGAMLGDHAGYYSGFVLGPRFHRLGLVQKYRTQVQSAEDLIRRYGSAAIFIGRFVPAIRSVIPALSGISGISRARYTLLDAAACILWALALGVLLFGIDEIF